MCARARVRAHVGGSACERVHVRMRERLPSPPLPSPPLPSTLPPRVFVLVFVVGARMCFWGCMCLCGAHCSFVAWLCGDWGQRGWLVSAVADVRWAPRQQLRHSEASCAPIHAFEYAEQPRSGVGCGYSRRHTCSPAYSRMLCGSYPAMRASMLPRRSISVLLRILLAGYSECSHPNAPTGRSDVQPCVQQCDDAIV